MSLPSHAPEPIPEETARIARAAFPGGNLYLRMRDHLAALCRDADFAHLFPARGRPAGAPWRPALVTIWQFAEGLSDRQAADAVRGRIDREYALSPGLTDAGFGHTVLSEFRTRLVGGEAGTPLLDVLLRRSRDGGLLAAYGRQRTDSTRVLAAVRALDRIESVQETMRHTSDAPATVAPDWLTAHLDPDWPARYARRAEDDRLPRTRAARQRLVQLVGGDGYRLLGAPDAPAAPDWLRTAPALRALRRVWPQNCQLVGGEGRRRTDEDGGLPPSARFLSSPYGLDSHGAKEATTSRIGSKHPPAAGTRLTETRDEDAPNSITPAETASAPVADGAVTPKGHQALKEQGLLPTTHLVGTGFLAAEPLVTSREMSNVELLGPTRKDQRWQARTADGYGLAHSSVDFAAKTRGPAAGGCCPQGHTSAEWRPRVDHRGGDTISIRFSRSGCGDCPARAECTGATRPRRAITVRPSEQHEALRQRRRVERSKAFAAADAKRAGMEGTISQGIRRRGMRRARYRGLDKTRVQHVATAAALNFVRTGDWLSGAPHATTRTSAFAAFVRKTGR